MADDEERLVVLLEARIRDLEKNMAKASGITGKTYREMSLGSKKATAQMEADAIRSSRRINQAFATVSTRVGVFGKAFGVGAFATLSTGALAALAPVLSLGAALAKTKEALEEFGNISDSAKASGLDAEFFQVLAHQSELGGVAVDQLSGALETFSKNAGLAAEGKGKMIKGLQALNPELLKNIVAATAQEERVRLAADAIDKAGSASEKAALSATLFGDAGTRLVEVFAGGSAAIDATAESARNLGIIIDREVIARAEEMGDELDTATKIMSLEFSKALVDLAPLLVDAARLAGDYAAAIARIVDSFRDLENQSTKGLNTQLAELGSKRLDTENQILALQSKQREEASEMSDTAKNLGFADSKNPQLFSGQIEELTKQRAEFLTQEEKIASILSGRNTVEPVTKPSETPVRPTGSAGTKSSRNAEAEAALREAEAVKELIADLEFERSLISMTEEQRRAAVITRQAGTAATKEQRDQIVALNEALHQEEEAQKRAAETAEFFKDASYDAFSSLLPQIETGNAALDSLINKMIEAVAQAALLGEGPLASLFGGGGGILSLFGFGGGQSAAPSFLNNGFDAGLPKFAKGGVATSPSIFGDDGAEAAVPLPDGRRIPVDLGNRGGGAGGQSVHVTSDIRVSVDQSGELKAFVERTSHEISDAKVRSYDRQMPDRVKQISSNPRKRG